MKSDRHNNNEKKPLISGTFFTGLLTFITLALMIPSLLNMQMYRKELKAKSNLREFFEANQAHWISRNKEYSKSINALIRPDGGPQYLDNRWLKNSRNGFLYSYIRGKDNPTIKFSMLAIPSVKGLWGRNIYCIDQRGIIMASKEGQNAPKSSSEGCLGGFPTIG